MLEYAVVYLFQSGWTLEMIVTVSYSYLIDGYIILAKSVSPL